MQNFCGERKKSFLPFIRDNNHYNSFLKETETFRFFISFAFRADWLKRLNQSFFTIVQLLFIHEKICCMGSLENELCPNLMKKKTFIEKIKCI